VEDKFPLPLLTRGVINPQSLNIWRISMLLIFSLLALTSAQASTTLLDCNVEGGDQQVKVVATAEGLELQELNSHGSWKSRVLSAKEWESKNLRLSGGIGETYVMYYDASNKEWLYQNVGLSFRQFGTAACN
jgi:hypothetical protein